MIDKFPVYHNLFSNITKSKFDVFRNKVLDPLVLMQGALGVQVKLTRESWKSIQILIITRSQDVNQGQSSNLGIRSVFSKLQSSIDFKALHNH